jgi:hypothetical protein
MPLAGLCLPVVKARLITTRPTTNVSFPAVLLGTDVQPAKKANDMMITNLKICFIRTLLNVIVSFFDGCIKKKLF